MVNNYISVSPNSSQQTNENTIKPITIEIMKDLIYNGKHIMTLKPTQWQGTPNNIIDDLLEEMFKLTRLYVAMTKYDSTKVKAIIQPFFDETQPIRCYLSETYITVEANVEISKPNSKYSKWIPLIINHAAHEKDTPRYYNFEIIPGFSDENLITIRKCIALVVETTEQYVFDLMNNSITTFEKIKKIRIGDEKTDKELELEAKAYALTQRELYKKEKQYDMVEKKRKIDEFWNKIFGKKLKVIFS